MEACQMQPPALLPPAAIQQQPPATWRMKNLYVIPGTLGSVSLRLAQFSAAVVAFSLMISAADFSTITAFCFLVAAMVLQCMWSISVATLEGYSWFLGRNLRDSPLLSLFAVGDWITAAVTFAGACASAGIAVLVGRDFPSSCVSHCGRYALAAGVAFLSWLLIFSSFLFTYWIIATR